MTSGGCLCGAVRYRFAGALSNPSGCHCTQCRRQTGHFLASGNVAKAELTLTRDDGLSWYRSSLQAERGFCRLCGSVLFWRGEGRDELSVALGGIDGATGTRLAKHIFVADKGDYYDLTDGLPQYPQGD